MNGLWKATNYYNRLEAWRDWEKLLATAGNVPLGEVLRVAPKPEYGWRRIDKCIAKLRELIAEYPVTK
jgi:hypothetical protein